MLYFVDGAICNVALQRGLAPLGNPTGARDPAREPRRRHPALSRSASGCPRPSLEGRRSRSRSGLRPSRAAARFRGRLISRPQSRRDAGAHGAPPTIPGPALSRRASGSGHPSEHDADSRCGTRRGPRQRRRAVVTVAMPRCPKGSSRSGCAPDSPCSGRRCVATHRCEASGRTATTLRGGHRTRRCASTPAAASPQRRGSR